MVKIFVGNLPRATNEDEIKALFTEYGTVTECAIIKNFAFVHMDDRKAATKAIKNLHLYKLVGPFLHLLRPHTTPEIEVRLGDRLPHQCPLPVTATPMIALHTEFHVQGTPTQIGCLRHRLHATLIKQGRRILKVRIGLRIVVRLRRRSAPPDARDSILSLSVAERVTFPCDADRRNRIADVHFAFVHMSNSDEAMDAIKGLDNTEFQGKRIHVQISKSRPRHEERDDYPPPPPDRGGYWPPRYPGEWPEPPPPGYMRGRLSHIPPGYPAPPLPPPPPRRAVYPDRPYDAERDRYGVVDYYEKYRARPYGMATYDDQRPGVPPPPPPPSAVVRDRLPNSSLDPYERRPLPPPPPSSYYARDRSPLRRPPTTPVPPASNGYSYDRSAYGVPRARDPYADRLPPPPPARYAY
ncbi:RNA-binding protein 4B-like [Neolamprologus brichardi]|nr:RNA-binding protein 4B-like [Neolamprologus brichardi]